MTIPGDRRDCGGRPRRAFLRHVAHHGALPHGVLKKDPALWLVKKLGKRKGKKKLAEIETYFGWVAQFQLEPEYDDTLECPDCGTGLFFGVDTGLWHCDGCGAAWRERQG